MSDDVVPEPQPTRPEYFARLRPGEHAGDVVARVFPRMKARAQAFGAVCFLITVWPADRLVRIALLEEED